MDKGIMVAFYSIFFLKPHLNSKMSEYYVKAKKW